MILNKLSEYFNSVTLSEKFTNKLTKHKIGSNDYKVYDNFTNKKNAAILLDNINLNLLKLLKYLDDKYNINNINYNYKSTKEDKVYILYAILRLKKNYRPFNIQENLPSIFDKDTSYTINKGDIFALCLRFVNNTDEFHDFNTIMFVALHEFAHLFSKTYGHNKEFWTNFRFILKNAVEMGIYKSVNYKYNNKPYCGIQITYSPLYDNKLRDY